MNKVAKKEEKGSEQGDKTNAKEKNNYHNEDRKMHEVDIVLNFLCLEVLKVYFFLFCHDIFSDVLVNICFCHAKYISAIVLNGFIKKKKE